MKNKRKNWNKEENMGYVIIIVLVILSFAVALSLIVSPLINLLPEYKITKEECWNETYLNYSHNQEIHRKIKIIKYYHRNIGCDYIKEMNTSNICYNNTLCAEYEKIIKFLLDSIPTPKNITKEVCAQVEVDKEYVDNLPINEEIIINLALLTYFYIGNKEGWFSEWLDENCAFQGGECSKWGKRNKEGISICKKEIIKYKCGSYLVEVK